MLTVIGVGNRLRGDDAVGPMLIDQLSDHAHSELELVDAGSDALGVLEYLDGRQKVIVVDACSMGREPGSLVKFDPAEAELILDEDPLSLHGIGLAETLRMAVSMNMLPKELKIFGIQPESIQFKGTLSTPVQRALEQALKKVQAEIQQVVALSDLES